MQGVEGGGQLAGATNRVPFRSVRSLLLNGRGRLPLALGS